MKLFILGGNGQTGRELLARALSTGDRVTALVRGEDRLADVQHEGLDVCVGDPRDPSVLEVLLPGHDVVISTLGPRWPTRAASAIYPDSAASMVEAMERSGVHRLLVTSSALLFPADRFSIGLMRRLVPSIVEGARRMEMRIGDSELDWTIVRTGFLNNSRDATCRYATGALPKDDRAVSRAALASFLLTEARQPSHVREVVGLCG